MEIIKYRRCLFGLSGCTAGIRNLLWAYRSPGKRNLLITDHSSLTEKILCAALPFRGRGVVGVHSLLECRVILVQRLAQEFAVQVGVDLRGGDAFVAEHLLHGAQVGAALHQVGGEGVTEGVGRDGLGDAGLLYQVFDDQEDHHAGEAAAPPVEEQYVFLALLHGLVDADGVGVQLDVLRSGGAHRHQALLIALADHPDKAHVKEKLRDLQVDHFAHAQPAAVHRFQDGLVAPAFRGAQVDLGNDVFNLPEGEGIGQLAFQPGALQQGGGVFGGDVLQQAVLIKGFDARDDAGLRGGGHAEAGHPFDKGLQVGQFHGRRGFFVPGGLQEGSQLFQVGQVGFDGIGREGFFQLQVGFEAFFVGLPHGGKDREKLQAARDKTHGTRCKQGITFIFG